MAKKNKNVLSRSSKVSWVIFAILLLDVILLLFLYIWILYTSLKTPFDFMGNQLFPSWPWEWTFENYKKSLALFESTILTSEGLYRVGFVTLFLNTLFRCVIAIGIGNTIQWWMAYLLGRFKGIHVTFLMNMFLFLMMIPIIGTTGTSLKLYKAIGIYDTWFMPILSAIPFFNFNFLIIQSFIKGVGMETIESAVMDGAGNFRLMWQIVFPQTFNAYLIMALGNLITTWNDYMTTVICMPSYPTLSYAVYSFSTSVSTGASLPPVQAAGSIVLAFPMILVFAIFKDKILGGITFAITK